MPLMITPLLLISRHYALMLPLLCFRFFAVSCLRCCYADAALLDAAADAA